MNHMLKLFTSAILCAALTACSTQSTKSSGFLGFGGSSYQLRPYVEKKLPNGLTVLFVEDKALPYTTYTMLLKTGSSSDPQDLPGLTSFVSELLDKGTTKRSAIQLADEFGRRGAEFGASVSPDYTTLGVSTLSTHNEDIFDLFMEILTEPTFSGNEVERVRRQITAAIKKNIDNPGSFSGRLWDQYLYDGHPYARPVAGTLKSIKHIRRKHLIQHYVKHFRPNNALFAVVGQYSPELMQKIESSLGKWESRQVPAVEFPAVPAISGVQVRVVDKPGLVQAQIRIGHKGIRRQSEDFIALRIANTILGGAFSSRLVDRVRKQLGLTYSIHSGFDARLQEGPFEISTFTKNESVAETVKETLNVYRDFTEKGVTDDEVDRAKGYLKGIFPASIETADRLAFNLLLLRFYGVPDSYLTTYLKEVDSVSARDVNRAIKKHMDPNNLKVLVYTSAPSVVPQFKDFTPVEVRKAGEFQ